LADSVRAFVAVDVDEALRGQVARVRRTLAQAAPGAKWVDPALCHITLKFLGYVAGERLPAIAEACRRAAGAVGPFELAFAGLGAFPRWRGARVLWMGLAPSSPLAALQTAVEAELAPLGFEPEGRPFAPHLTLARFKQPSAPELEEAARRFADASFGAVPVRELRLMRSDLRPSGPVYSVLDAFGLSGSCPAAVGEAR
jgi:RNA 2',3'-cyclic 3'-phosphodiesterase